MWLPESIYKRAPHYWMLLGIVFVAVGTYRTSMGDFPLGLVSLFAGIASCFWSLQVALRRRTQHEDPTGDLDLQQTCELNYKPE